MVELSIDRRKRSIGSSTDPDLPVGSVLKLLVALLIDNGLALKIVT